MSKSVLFALLGMSLAGAAFADDDHGWWHSHVSEVRDNFSHERNDASDPVAAPEIDPASALGGLTLLVGGIAVIRARKK